MLIEGLSGAGLMALLRGVFFLASSPSSKNVNMLARVVKANFEMDKEETAHHQQESRVENFLGIWTLFGVVAFMSVVVVFCSHFLRIT